MTPWRIIRPWNVCCFQGTANIAYAQEHWDDGRSLGLFHIEELLDVYRFSAIVRVGKCWRIPRTANVTFVGKGHVENWRDMGIALGRIEVPGLLDVTPWKWVRVCGSGSEASPYSELTKSVQEDNVLDIGWNEGEDVSRLLKVWITQFVTQRY